MLYSKWYRPNHTTCMLRVKYGSDHIIIILSVRTYTEQPILIRKDLPVNIHLFIIYLNKVQTKTEYNAPIYS